MCVAVLCVCVLVWRHILYGSQYPRQKKSPHSGQIVFVLFCRNLSFSKWLFLIELLIWIENTQITIIISDTINNSDSGTNQNSKTILSPCVCVQHIKLDRFPTSIIVATSCEQIEKRTFIDSKPAIAADRCCLSVVTTAIVHHTQANKPNEAPLAAHRSYLFPGRWQCDERPN